MIRDYHPEDRTQVYQLVMDLEKYYPSISSWLQKQLDKIEKGEVTCKIAIEEGEIGGVAITEKKNDYSAKLKTFYLKEKFQQSALGPRLLKVVLDHWIKEGIKKIYVTFAEEEVEELYSFFRRYGFTFAGISPFAYRSESMEYIMNKIQIYQSIGEEEFQDFVYDYIFRTRGYKLVEKGKNWFVVDRIVSPKPNRRYVKTTTDPDVSEDMAKKLMDEAEEKECSLYSLVSFYSLPSDLKESQNIETYDGYDFETLFYPAVLQRQKFPGGVQTIDKTYANRLFYDPKQMLLTADQKTLRTDNVFYKKPRGYKELERGSTILFYQSDKGGIIGEGKLKRLDIDTPENLHDKYGGKGVFSLEDIKQHSENGKALALFLGITTRYPKKIELEEVREVVPNFNPQGSMSLTQEKINKIRQKGGYPIKWESN